MVLIFFMGVLDGLMRFHMFMIVPKRDKTHKNHQQLFAGCLMVGGTDDSCASPNKSRYPWYHIGDSTFHAQSQLGTLCSCNHGRPRVAARPSMA